MPQMQSKYRTEVVGPGRNIGWFGTFSGGQVAAESAPDKAPGQKFPSKGAGDPDISDITVSRRVQRGRDTAELRRWLRNRISIEKAFTVAQKELDSDGNAIDDGDTYECTLLAVNPPETDINAGNEYATLTLVFAASNVR